MKVRKLSALALALVLVIAMTSNAFAATKDLGKPNFFNMVQQQGWATDSLDDERVTAKNGITVDDLRAATQIVIELNSPCPNADNKLFVGTDVTGWADGNALEKWQSNDGMTITFDLLTDPELAHWRANVTDDEPEFVFFGVQAWNDDWMDIKSAYLVLPDAAGGGDVPAAEAPAAEAPAAGGGNPATGESTIIYVAGVALLAAAGALIVIRKRAKSN